MIILETLRFPLLVLALDFPLLLTRSVTAKKPLIMTSVVRPEEQRCQKRGKFFLTLPMIRLCPEARVLITLNLVCITSNGPNGHKII